MGLHLGHKKVKELYLGNKRVTEMYLGNNLVYKYPSGEGGGDKPIKPSTDGVYILGIDNVFYSVSGWTKPSADAVGIAVISGEHSFIVSHKTYDKVAWSKKNVDIRNVTSEYDSQKAASDFKGYENTQQILMQDKDAAAAIACDNYQFKNGMKGYLPSLGELKILFKNKKEYNRAARIIEGYEIGKDMYYDVYWSSTLRDNEYAWTDYLYDDYTVTMEKFKLAIVLPFGKI